MRKAIGSVLLAGVFWTFFGTPAHAAEKNDFLKFFRKSGKDEPAEKPKATAASEKPVRRNFGQVAPAALPAAKVRYATLPPTRSYPVPRDPNRSIIRIPQPPPPPPRAPSTEFLKKAEKRPVRTK